MLEHLDNRKMVIKPPAGAIVRPETLQGVPHVMCVPDEGMPRKGAPFEKGRLFVLFTIKFPDNYSLGDEQVVVGGAGWWWWLGRRRVVGRARRAALPPPRGGCSSHWRAPSARARAGQA